MTSDRPDRSTQAHASAGPRFRHAWVFWIFLAIALAFLALEHRVHLLGALPYLLLLACPLMHLFMHHGGHGQEHHDDAEHRR